MPKRIRSYGSGAGTTNYHLLDLTTYGRRETWEDSPVGWPRPWANTVDQFRTDGQPTAQSPRLTARRAPGPMTSPDGCAVCSDVV